MNNILLINAHQKYEGFAEGKLNQSLIDIMQEEALTRGKNVKITNIEAGYNTDEELQKHLWADLIVIQTPLYWMSVPWIAKKYFDEVYTLNGHGVLWENDGRTHSDLSKKYGSGGLVKNKNFMLSTTLNAPPEAFNNKEQFFEGRDMDELFFWLQKMYNFMGFGKVKSFHCYNVIKEPTIEADFKRLREHMDSILR